MKNNSLFQKYPYIVADGQRWSSDRAWVEAQCELAEKEKAPVNSYCKIGGKWTIAEGRMKEELDAYINGTKGGILRQ